MDESNVVSGPHWSLLAVGMLVGTTGHYALFIRGEWHVQAPSIVVFHAWLQAFLFLGKAYYRGSPIGPAFDGLVVASFGYYVGLFASIILYRLCFHPLTKTGFPGPTAARVSKLWHVWACRHSKNYLVLADLNEKYGDFVRTGPSEITIFHPGVFMAVDGPRSECIKSEWYDILNPNQALVTARVKPVHAARRRQWNRGFTAKSLVQHEDKILKNIDELETCIEADAIGGKVSDARNYFFWFGFDAMGDFVLSRSFDMLKNHQWHQIVVRLQRALSLLGPLSPAPWLVQVGFKLAPRVGVLKDWFEMVAWCETQMIERIKIAEDKELAPDLTHYLMEEGETQKVGDEAWRWLKGDSLLAIVAGSEPTASVLVGLFCELARYPAHAEKIFEEVKDLDVRDVRALSELPHLNAVINEALRLYPALLTGGARKTTENGMVVGDTFIPPQTTVIAPRYSISRREDCFERGNEFIPERWYGESKMVRNAAAFTPFGTGHHSCLGRFLATDTMRLVTARLVKRFSFQYAPGETGLRVVGDLRDQFTSNPGGLDLSFALR